MHYAKYMSLSAVLKNSMSTYIVPKNNIFNP